MEDGREGRGGAGRHQLSKKVLDLIPGAVVHKVPLRQQQHLRARPTRHRIWSQPAHVAGDGPPLTWAHPSGLPPSIRTAVCRVSQSKGRSRLHQKSRASMLRDLI